MTDSKYKISLSQVENTGINISRRNFFKDISVFSLMAFFGAGLFSACNSVPSQSSETAGKYTESTPSDNGITLMEAIKNRKSVNSMKTDSLPESVLLELLWVAWGINRPDIGKRTAPSAMNTQEIDLYVLTTDGVRLYDATENKLNLILDEDLRPKSGGKEFMTSAPVHLIYVADYGKFRAGSRAEKENWSACHTGFIGQNVYLYCTTRGLGAHFYAAMDHDTLKQKLSLNENQAVVFGQAVGYSNE